jgi:hypothetical protein
MGEAGSKEYNDAAFDTYNKQSLVVCTGCSRTFLPDSLVKHQKGSCAGGAKESSQLRTIEESPINRKIPLNLGKPSEQSPGSSPTKKYQASPEYGKKSEAQTLKTVGS